MALAIGATTLAVNAPSLAIAKKRKTVTNFNTSTKNTRRKSVSRPSPNARTKRAGGSRRCCGGSGGR